MISIHRSYYLIQNDIPAAPFEDFIFMDPLHHVENL